MKCDTCRFLVPSKVRPDDYYVCSWTKPLPANAFATVRIELESVHSTEARRWIPKRSVDKGSHYIVDCPAWEAKD